MDKMVKKVAIYSMVGLMQLGLAVSVIEASPRGQEPPRQEQRDDKRQHEQERERRIQEENERHEREMRRRDHESEHEWHERQRQEKERHDKAIKAITGLILHILENADKD
ncbi:hypothetical protein [Sporomusa malonica]|uniref:Uncharacterized protein n=1 Tax=Sporomusa malonica TaxID=112901 RepID=A0A1W2ERG9_9FIRM|nr:hypothetical protein [Sporomusa malonica]SMD12319.1 hypothetical protein SAMN04488500_12855 [Sporomusa malonica]